MLPRAALRRPTVGPATILAAAALLLLIVLWGSVLIGHRVLIGVDILYQLPPWSGAAGAHPARNPLVADPVLQMLPWQGLVGDAFSHFRLPLWNPMALSGAPLLGNDQSAAFSPFTWLALPFSPARGLSLAMLAKLVVAAVGMTLFVRLLDARALAAVVAGIIYAGSSYMVVWLAWPQSGVAALIPFAFAAVEWYLRSGRRIALIAVAVTIALQFFGGHAETSLHMGGALALYSLIRLVSLDRQRVRRALELAAAALTGTLLAGIQLAPFVTTLSRSSISADRAAAGFGLGHLRLSDLSSWVIPNARGNPGIDGLLGRPPNYNESTGFATVTALLLAPIGLWWTWARQRSVAIALAAVGLLAAGVAYGPLTPIAGRLPGLNVSGNERLLAVICLVLAAFAGLGFEWLLQRKPGAGDWQSAALFGIGVVAIAGLGLCALLLLRRSAAVDHLLPAGPRGYIGFWLLVAALSLAAAACLIAAWMQGFDRRLAAAAVSLLVLGEVALFAGPYNPRVPIAEVPPASAAMDYLRSHPGVTAATGLRMAPEAATLYGVTDARGYDTVIDRRQRAFWSAADAGYSEAALFTLLDDHPDPRFLAAAGVNYLMTSPDAVIPGTDPVFSGEGVVISSVPGARPFAFMPDQTIEVGSMAQARTVLAGDPLGAVAIEGCCAPSGGGSVDLVARRSDLVQLTVQSAAATTVVVLQSYDPGWVARIDGRAARIYPADVLFQAVPVPGGTHHVSLSYEPQSLLLGEAMSLLALIVLLAAAVRLALPSRRLR